MQGIVRYPTQLGDHVAFVAEDDLWCVPATGGRAERLAPLRGHPAHLHADAAGARIAFTSTEEGARDVYLWDAATGAVRRLTHEGSVLRVCGWSPEGRVVFSSSHDRPFARDHRLYGIDPDGGWPEALGLGPAVAIAWGPAGQLLLGRHRTDASHWRGYRGGRRGHLWWRPSEDAAFLPWQPEHALLDPTFAGGRILAVADPDLTPQVVSLEPTEDGVTVRPLTEHPPEAPVRHLQATADQAVYVAGPELWCLDADGLTRQLPVELRSTRPERSRRFVDPALHLEAVAAHPDGARGALVVRGKPFVLGWFEGAPRQLGERQGVRYRCPCWVGDEHLALASDHGGQDGVELHALDGTVTRLADLDGGRPLRIVAEPDGRHLLVLDHRHHLWRLPTDGRAPEGLHRGERPVVDLDVSPDGAWLCFAVEVGRRHGPTQLRLRPLPADVAPASDTDGDCDGPAADASADQPGEIALTSGRYRDLSPSFDPDGHHLFFLSYREFDPVYDAQSFDLGFPRGARPYAVVLDAEAPDPFRPAPAPLKPPTSKPPKEPVAVRVDPEGIAARVSRFPLVEARYHRVIAVGGGKVYLLRSGVQGASQRRMYDPGPGRPDRQLVQWDFDQRKAEVVNDKVSWFGVSPDRGTLWIRADKQLRVGPAHPDKTQLAELRKPSARPGRPTGFVDLPRLRVEVDPAAEWRQMLHETARLMREHHFDPDTGSEVSRWLPVYERELDRVAGRGELSDLLQRFQGSLGTSHAYEVGGDHRSPPRWQPGSLGADIRWDQEAQQARIRRVVVGEAEDPGRRSPLVGPGTGVPAGAVLLAIGGTPITHDHPPSAALAHLGGTEVELTVALPDGETRQLTVRALHSDRAVRYRDQVIAWRDQVHTLSAGRVGYVHVPNMGPTGFADFHRDYLVECEREALIVDVRHNTGGHVSQLLLEKLARRRLGRVVPRWGVPSSYPSHAVAGPIVALTDAHAGSDGDIFSHVFKRMGLGPLVGTRTWGGTVGVVARHYLVDRSLVTQPEFAHWFDDVGFGLENYGTDPDIAAPYPPEGERHAVDPQLEAAIRIALERLDETPIRPDPAPTNPRR